MNWITKIIKAGEKIKTAFHKRATKEDIAYLEQQFDNFDIDGDGSITVDEFHKCYKKFLH